MLFRRVLIIAMMGLTTGGWLLSAFADGPLVLTADRGEYPLGLHLSLLEDPTRALSIEQVSSPAFADSFSPSTQPVPNFGYSSSAHWARIELTHALPRPQEWLLEVADPTLNSVTLFLPRDDGDFIQKQTGDLYPRTTRDIDAPNFLFTLPLSPNQTSTLYLRIENNGSTPLPVTLWSQAAYAVKSDQMMFAFGFFYGFIFIMICYNLVIYSFLRESTYLFYVLTVTGLGAYFASLDGLAAQYLWPNWLWWGNVSILVFIGLTLIGGIGFSTRFLTTAARWPGAHRVLVWVQRLCGGLVLLAMIPALYGLVGRGLAVVTVFVSVAGVWLGVTAWRAGFASARYYLLAWGALFVGAVLVVLMQFGWLPANLLTENSLRLGIFLLVLFLSLALADRINLLRSEAEQSAAQIQEAHHRFNQFLEAMPVGVCLIDANYNTEFLNQRGREILAVPDLPDARPPCLELQKNGALKIAGSDSDFPDARLPYRRALHGESVYEADLELKLPDKRIPLEMWARPVFNDQGDVNYAAVAFQDISERRQVEDELLAYRQNLEALIEQRTHELAVTNRQLEQDIQLRRQNEEQLRILSRAVEQSVNTILITDLSGKIEYVNPTVFSTAGYTPQEIIGKKPNIFKSGKNDPALYEELWQTIVRGDTWHGELINCKKNGELYWEKATISPMKDSNGHITHYLAVKEDISLRKEINQSTHLHHQHLALINHAGRIFNSTLELDEVIEIMLSEMHQLMNIEATSYWLLEPETRELVCQQATGPGREVVMGWRLPLGVGLTGQAAQKNQVLVISDCYRDERHFKEVDKQTGVKLHSLLIVPMHIKGEVIGVLNLGDTKIGRFSGQDAALIEPIAAVATSAIKNAQLFKESQHQHKVAESLRSVAAVLGSSLDFDTVLQKIFEQLAQVIDYDGAGLFLEDNNRLTLVEATGTGKVFIGHSVSLDSHNFTVLPFLQRESVVVTDVQNDPRWYSDWPDYDHSQDSVKSWMGVPMLRDDEPLGVLTVDSFIPNAYKPQDAKTLQMFAGQASIALQNARYVEQTRQALHRTQILYRVSSTLAKSMDFTSGVTGALAELLHALGLQQGGITLFSADKKSGTLLVLFKDDRLQPIEKPIQIVSEIYGHVIASRQPYVVFDALTDPLLADSRNLTVAHDIKSMLLVPLLVRGEVIGVIGADSTTEQRNFSSRDIGLAQSIADQVATALENANLLEQEQRQRRMAEGLRQVVLVINSSLNQDTVISKILEQLRQVIRFDSAGLFLLDGDLLRLTDGANIRDELLGYGISIHSNNRTAKVLKQKMPIITPDVRTDPYWEVPSPSGPILGWMAAPLLVGDEAIGVLTLDSYTPNVYTAEDAQTLLLFANHAAMAIQNARLYQETQQALAQLQDTQSQLIVQEKMASLGLLTAGIAHEIKNPLNFVTSFAQLTVELTHDLRHLLVDHFSQADGVPPDINQILDNLRFNATSITEEGFRANNIVDSMLLHSRGGSQQPQSTNINTLIEEAVTLTKHSLKAKDPEFQFVINTSYDDSLPPLVVIPQNLGRVFVNLINNAYAATLQKFTQTEMFTGLLQITTKNLGDSVEISVKDNGVGLTPEVQDNLFAPFFTTKPTGKGTGLGLSISYDIIVQEHGGTIDVNSVPGEFAEFVITLPISPHPDWSQS